MGSRVRISVIAAACAVALSLTAAGCGGGTATVGREPSRAPTVPSTATATAITPSGSTPVTTASAGASPAGTASPAPSAAADLGQYAAGRSDVVSDPVYPQYGDAATDVLHYGLDLAWNPVSTVLTGTATLTVRAARATDRFVLDLGRPLSADSVSVDGAAVTATRDGEHLTVPLGRLILFDTVSTVVITYHGTPSTVPAPMVRADIAGVGATVTADGAIWAQQEPYGAFTWYPCNDQPSDKALYDVAITAPDGWSGVSGGAYQGRTETGGGQGVDRWHQPDPASSYLVAFAVDRFQQETATGPNGLPVTYWYPPAQAAAVHQFTAQIPEMITFLEKRFGPYPFPTAGVLFLAQPVGMETQTMITLGVGAKPDDLLHEFAHQWFGDAVTPKTWTDLWLNEGFAMYAQFQWDFEHLTAQAGVADFDTFMNTRIRPADQVLRTQHGPPGHYIASHFASSNVYYCPALMLNEIRHQVGDAAFTSLLDDWAHHAKDSNQDRAAFTAYANQHTGKNLTALIDLWLDSPNTPS